MGGEHDKERAAAIAAGEAVGWRVGRVTVDGYTIMLCGCGTHRLTLHKTPSNPDHFRQKGKRMATLCNKGVPS